MGQEVQLLEEALIRVTQELCLISLPHGQLGGSLRLPDLMSPADCFDWSVRQLGEIARDSARHLEQSVAATALIEARGDRIERLNADNRALLDEIVSGRSLPIDE